MDFTQIGTYPMEREDWLKTVVIGGILTFFGFLLVPLILVNGYVIRAIRTSLAGEPEPPVFDEWGELAGDGVQAWVIGIIYMIVPGIVAALTIGGSIAAAATGGEAGVAAGIGGLMVGLTLSTLLGIAFGYLAVAALVNFAREDSFGAAFDVDVLRTVAFDREYAIAWLVSLVVFIAAGIVASVPLVGWLVGPFVGFYGAVVAANLWAGGFSRAMESTADPVRPTDEEPAV